MRLSLMARSHARPRAGCAAAVDRDDDETLIGQPAVEEIAGPRGGDHLRMRSGIDADDHRIAFSGLKVVRADDGRVLLRIAADRDQLDVRLEAGLLGHTGQLADDTSVASINDLFRIVRE